MKSADLEAIKTKYDHMQPETKKALRGLIKAGYMPKTITRLTGGNLAGQQDIYDAARYLLQLKRIGAL